MNLTRGASWSPELKLFYHHKWKKSGYRRFGRHGRQTATIGGLRSSDGENLYRCLLATVQEDPSNLAWVLNYICRFTWESMQWVHYKLRTIIKKEGKTKLVKRYKRKMLKPPHTELREQCDSE